MIALVIYEEWDFAANVSARLEGATQRSDATIHWSVKPWRVDILQLAAADERALAEASEAHLIVLAVRRVQCILPWLVTWLERWAMCRQIQEATLAIWQGTSADVLSAQTMPELSHLADAHRLRLMFADTSMFEGECARAAGDEHSRALHQLDHYQHGGLNE
jgi:hypothetical protein